MPPVAERPELMVGILPFHDFTLTPLAGFVDALRLAADHADDSRQVHCGWEFLADEIEPVRSSCGLQVMPARCFADAPEIDYLVVVGGRVRDGYRYPRAALDYIRRTHETGVPLVGLCTGSMALAEAGMLSGRRCSVHFAAQAAFTARYRDVIPVTDANFVVDGTIITCPGSIAAIDVATYLIQRHCGRTRARKATNYLLMEPDRPRISHPERAYEDKLSTASRIAVDAVRMMEMQLDRPMSVAQLAASVNATPARLARAFSRDMGTTPARFWRSLRLDHAKSLVVDTAKPITTVAYETGFSDAAHFCRAFRKAFGAAPQAYRRRARR